MQCFSELMFSDVQVPSLHIPVPFWLNLHIWQPMHFALPLRGYSCKELGSCSYKLLQGNKTTLFFRWMLDNSFLFVCFDGNLWNKQDQLHLLKWALSVSCRLQEITFYFGGGGSGMWAKVGRLRAGESSEKDKCRHFVSSQHGQRGKQWRTKGHRSVVDIRATNCCCFHQPYVQLRSFYSAAYGTIVIEFFLIIDLTCIILFILGELIQADWD